MGVLLGERPGRTVKVHPHLGGEVIGLAPIAPLAGKHDVVPTVRCTAPRDGDDVIDGELRGNGDQAAVLAGVVVAKQQIAPVGPEHPARDVDVAEQAHDDHVLGDAPVLEGRRSADLRVRVQEGDPLLAQQHDQPPMADHVQRL